VPAKISMPVSTVRSFVLELVSVTGRLVNKASGMVSSPVPLTPSTIEAGRMTVTVGTMKLVALNAVPSGFATEIRPVVAAPGTVAVIWVGLLAVNEAEAPLKATVVAVLKFAPVMTTEVPAGPPAGEKLVTVGGLAEAEVEVTATLSKLIFGLLPVVPTLLAY